MLNVTALLLSLVALAGSLQAPSAPATPAAPAVTSAKIWEGRAAEFEEFIRTAPFARIEEVPIGVTKPKRGYFAPGGLAASAAWKVLPPGRPNGYWESYRSEIAAYELDKLLAIGMIPPVVEKKWQGERGAAILWLKPVRSWKEVEPLPKPETWNRQAVRMKMFDNLVGNIDRNQGNMLVDLDWNLFLIDHSRAFVTDKKLPFTMTRIDRELWDRMRALDEPTLKGVLGNLIDGSQIRAILARRDRMQTLIDSMLKTSGESVVYVK